MAQKIQQTLSLSTYTQGMSWLGRAASLNYSKDADGHNYFMKMGYTLDQYNHSDVRELIEKGYVGNPHVYAVINHMLTPLLQIPWAVYQIKDKRAFKQYQSYKRTGQATHKMFELASKAVDVYQGENDATRLVDRPNPEQTFGEFICTIFGMMCLSGNGYIYGNDPGLRSSKGIVHLLPLPSQFMEVLAGGTWTGKPTGYKLHLSPNQVQSFEAGDIEHIKHFNPNLTYAQGDYYTLARYGISPLTPFAKQLHMSNDGFEAQMRLLQHGHPLGLLSNESELAMTNTEREEAETGLNFNQSSSNYGKIRLATGKVRWVEFGLNAVDMQLESLQSEVLSILCTMYGLPAPNVTGKNANFNTGKEAEKQKWNDAILPRLNPIVDHLNRFLKAHGNLPEGMFIDYDHHAVPSLQQDRDKFLKSNVMLFRNAILNRGQFLQATGIDAQPADHDDEYFIENNLRNVNDPAPGTQVVDPNAGDAGDKRYDSTLDE